MLKKLFLFSVLLCSSIFLAKAQIYTEPTFPTENDKVTIYFDATKGTGGLKDCNCDVYVHTGVLTSAGGGWKYVKMQWGVANADWKMTKVSANLYKYELGPTIREYYNVPAGEEVYQLAFVFRNGAGTAEGKADGAKDIFYNLSSPNIFLARLLEPAKNSTILKKDGETITVKAASSINSQLILKDNGVIIKEIANGKDLNHTITAGGASSHTVDFIGINGQDTVKESFTYLLTQSVTVQNPPAGTKLGATQSGNDITLMLNAKDKGNVFVIGDFSDWKIKPENLMRKSVDGSKWWIELKNLPNGAFRYQYIVDASLKIADPHSEVILDEGNDKSVPASAYPNLPAFPSGKTSGYVSYLEIPRKAYNWQVTNFKRPAKKDMVVYELLLRDFSTQRNMSFLLDTLDYLKHLGVNAIEFMPINEFDGNQSWGYNPTLHHALDKYYGSPDIFKKVVDECHKRGIAIILDIVFNHVSEKGPIAQLYPISNSPYVNAIAKHPYNVFLDMNHESIETKEYVNRCLEHWLQEYRIDGYRFDLSKGLTQTNSGSDVGKWGQYDASRVKILKGYTDHSWNAGGKDAYMIMEHFGEFKEEKEMTDYGMMVWQNLNYAFGQGLMGFSGSNITSSYYAKHGFSNPGGLVYAESHDEERNAFRGINYGNASGNYVIKNQTTMLRRAELMGVFLLGIPGPKMIWQFGELGYDYSINDCGNGTISNNCRLSNKPIRWDYLEDARRLRLHDVYASMAHLKKTHPAFQSTDVAIYAGGNTKQVIMKAGADNMLVLGNFDVTSQELFVDWPEAATYYDYFTGEALEVKTTDQNLTLLPGEYRLYTTKKLPVPIGGYKSYTGNKDVLTQVVDFEVFPNPTTNGEATQIVYELTEKSNLSLLVTDLTGRVVKQVAKGNYEAGTYQFDLTEDLPQGAYIVQLSIGNQSVAKRLLKL